MQVGKNVNKGGGVGVGGGGGVQCRYDGDLIPYALDSENVIPDVIPNSRSIIYS